MQKQQQVEKFESELLRLRQLLKQLADTNQWAAMRRCDQQVTLLVAQISHSGLKPELAESIAALKASYATLLAELSQQQTALGTLLNESKQQAQATSAYQFTMDATAK